MASKESLPPTTPLLCDHITLQTNTVKATVVSVNNK